MRCLVLLAVACGPRLPDVPSAGGPAWHEIASMHFRMWTDAPVERGQQLVQRMEWLRSVIYGVAFPDLPPGGTTFVIALADKRESSVFTPPSHLAFTASGAGNPLRLPTIVMPGDAYGDDVLVTHELVHAIAFNAIHRQPRWFAEGLATYFETIDLDMKKGTVDVGLIRPQFREFLERRGLSPVETMFACGRLSCTDDFKFYATAWAMFAYLYTNRTGDLAKYEASLETTPPEQAWNATFPELTPATFDQAMRSWLVSGGYRIASFTIEKRTWPTQVRELGDADVRGVRAVLYYLRNPKSPDASGNADASLALDRTNLFGEWIYAEIHGAARTADDARAVAAAHPGEYLAWLLVASTIRSGDEHDAALAKACRLMAANPSVAKLDKLCR